jgi:hypothetical protein
MWPFTEKYRFIANVYCKLAVTRTRRLLHMCYKLAMNFLILMFLSIVLSYSKCCLQMCGKQTRTFRCFCHVSTNILYSCKLVAIFAGRLPLATNILKHSSCFPASKFVCRRSDAGYRKDLCIYRYGTGICRTLNKRNQVLVGTNCKHKKSLKIPKG